MSPQPSLNHPLFPWDLRPTQYLKIVRDSQWFEIIRVQLAGVGPGVRLGHIDNDEIRPHQADPVVSLDMHRHRPDPSSQHPGPVLPYQDHGAKVGDLTNIRDVRGEDTKLRQMVFSEFLQTKVTLNFNSSSLTSNLNEERCRLVVEMEISTKLIQLQDRRILLSRNILFP